MKKRIEGVSTLQTVNVVFSFEDSGSNELKRRE